MTVTEEASSTARARSILIDDVGTYGHSEQIYLSAHHEARTPRQVTNGSERDAGWVMVATNERIPSHPVDAALTHD